VKIPKTVKERDLIQKAEQALRECVMGPPFIRSIDFEKKPLKSGASPDFVARITTPEGEKSLLVEFRYNGEPRYARQAINQLILYTQRSPNSYGVFIAPYISPASAQMLKEANIGYVDLAGNCFLSFEKVFINIGGKENPYPQSKDLRTLFSPRASRIIRVLLNGPYTPWKLEELSRSAGVSLGLAAKVKKLLLDKEWIEEKPVGFALAKPSELLEEWASQYTYKKNQVSDLYSIKDGSVIEQELNDYCNAKSIRFALTLFSGASRVAPYATFNRVYAYVEGGVQEMMLEKALGLKPVGTGPNVTLLQPYDEGVFYGGMKYEGIPVVSPIQLYLDLKGYKGRGEEAAQFLFEGVIQPSWEQRQSIEQGK
jgi:hypothetical protein